MPRPAPSLATPADRPGRRTRLGRLLLAAGLLAAACARGGPLGDRVFAIEAAHGADPQKVVALLAPLEAEARDAPADDRRTFLAAWGYAHAMTEKHAVADAAIEELTELGERGNDPASLASAYALKATTLQLVGQLRAAFGWIESAVPLVGDTASPDLRYWVHMTAGELALSNGQVDEAVRGLEAAVRAAREERNPRREAQSLLLLVPLRLARGETAAAQQIASQVQQLAQQQGDPELEAGGWVMESLIAEATGDRRRTDRARQRALALAAGTAGNGVGAGGWLHGEGDALANLADLHLSLGNYASARSFAQRAHDHAQARGDAAGAAYALFDAGLAELGAGRVQAGMKAADTALDWMAELGRDVTLLVQLNRYVSALDRHGETAESWRRLREALLLETELARRDRQSTVVALQRESSYQQRQRQVEQLQHDNALQAAEIARRAVALTLSLLLAGAMGTGGFVAWRLYRRTREANRRLAHNNAALAHASTHDAVTGLLNRRAMEADTQALAGRPYACISLTVKQFSRIVGSVGHEQGDQLLCQIADRLEAAAARFDGRMYRVDGVTFCAIVAGRDGGPGAGEMMAALSACMARPFGVGNRELVVAIGAGAARHPRDADSATEVMRLAELAKLQGQAEPGNTCVAYDARIGEHQRDRLLLEARLLKALQQGEYELHYQGQRDVASGRFTGFEALLRWRERGTHGERLVSPAEFIPLAEDTGLIVPIGAWVLREACRQARSWADAGWGAPKVAVNISPRQFNHPGFMDTVRAALRDTGADPAQVELEITEGSVMNDAEASIAQLHALRAMGLKLAIDDFGTGFASLAYLRRFPLDRLKIDRSFVRPLGGDGRDDTIVRSVIELAHGLGLSVTAEGVETAAQEALLARWGCDVVQGFLHSRPGPAAGATALLREQGVTAPA